MKNYQGKILEFMNKTTEPVDVKQIQKTCGIGNWNTALKHCLELHIQGKIRGQKTPKGWMFRTNKETRLRPWEEAIGSYEALEVDENKVTLTLALKSLKLTFPKESLEAQTLIHTLTNTPKGTKIGIIRTDNPKKPLITRVLTATTDAVNRALALLLFRSSILGVAFKDFRLVALKFALMRLGSR